MYTFCSSVRLCHFSPICGLQARVLRTKSGSSVDIFYSYLRYFKCLNILSLLKQTPGFIFTILRDDTLCCRAVCILRYVIHIHGIKTSLHL